MTSTRMSFWLLLHNYFRFPQVCDLKVGQRPHVFCKEGIPLAR